MMYMIETSFPKCACLGHCQTTITSQKSRLYGSAVCEDDTSVRSLSVDYHFSSVRLRRSDRAEDAVRTMINGASRGHRHARVGLIPSPAPARRGGDARRYAGPSSAAACRCQPGREGLQSSPLHELLWIMYFTDDQLHATDGLTTRERLLHRNQVELSFRCFIRRNIPQLFSISSRSYGHLLCVESFCMVGAVYRRSVTKNSVWRGLRIKAWDRNA